MTKNKWDDNENLRVLVSIETSPGELRKLVKYLHCKQLVGQLLPDIDPGDGMNAKVMQAAAREFGFEILGLENLSVPSSSRHGHEKPKKPSRETAKNRGGRLKITLDKTNSM